MDVRLIIFKVLKLFKKNMRFNVLVGFKIKFVYKFIEGNMCTERFVELMFVSQMTNIK
jgi:hypothetical protein